MLRLMLCSSLFWACLLPHPAQAQAAESYFILLPETGSPVVAPGTEVPPAEMLETTVRKPLRKLQLTLDASLLGGSIGLAGRINERNLLGIEGGLGLNFANYMVVAGRHFSQNWSYEERDESGGEQLVEVAHLSVFWRHERKNFEIDTGFKTTAFLHIDDSDDDPGSGTSYGAYSSLFFGTSRIKFGPSVFVGTFKESKGEFGVQVQPLIFRIRIR